MSDENSDNADIAPCAFAMRRRSAITLGWLWGAGMLLFVGLLVLKQLFGWPLRLFLTDPVNALQWKEPIDPLARPFVGMITSIGLVLWAASAAVCSLGRLLGGDGEDGQRLRSMLRAFGIASIVLLFDDMLMLHEKVLPVAVGIPEKAVLATYAVAAPALLLRYRTTILRTEYGLLALAIASLGVSVGIDWVPNTGIFLEDLAKFLGIIALFVYLRATAAQAIEMRRSATP